MQIRSFVTLLALAGLAFSSIGLAQSPDRINPMIALHERGLPVFGVTHPAIVAGRAPGSVAPSLVDAARETVAYRFSDFAYDNYSSATADRFRGYMEAMLAAGGSAREHAFIAQVPIIHTDLMARGFTVFTMQRRDTAAFDAIAAGRMLSGRR